MSSVFFFKTIKPKKMKDKEIMRLVRNAIVRIGRGIQKDYENTVKTWNDKPTFTMSRDLSHTPIGFFVGTDDQRYQWVDKGTQTGREEGAASDWYPIFPRNKKALSYQGDFVPKTVPQRLTSREGGKSGEYVVRAYVEHPGIEAREFTTEIRKKWEPRFKKQLEQAIKSGVKASGHST